jgi:insertion element IS1 protein InsB
MNCPKCHSNNIRKNGHRRGKQNYQCKNCNRQFIDLYSEVGYSKKIKEDCLTMYVNGNGFRGIERITKVNHNTVIRWVRETGEKISNGNQVYTKPVVAQLDELFAKLIL